MIQHRDGIVNCSIRRSTGNCHTSWARGRDLPVIWHLLPLSSGSSTMGWLSARWPGAFAQQLIQDLPPEITLIIQLLQTAPTNNKTTQFLSLSVARWKAEEGKRYTSWSSRRNEEDQIKNNTQSLVFVSKEQNMRASNHNIVQASSPPPWSGQGLAEMTKM